MSQHAQSRSFLHTHGCLCKIILSIIAIAITNSAYSTNIDSTNHGCTNSSLTTYSGSASLEADWQPNTIGITFYSDNSEYATGQCTYDDTLTLPQTDPTKTGYTFSGWRVRTSAAPSPVSTSCIDITDEEVCGDTEGCIYNYGNNEWLMYISNGGNVALAENYLKEQEGCGKRALAESLPYTSCAAITDRETCLGVTDDDETSVCYWADGQCDFGFYAKTGDVWSVSIPEAWCDSVIQKWPPDCWYDEENGYCSCQD